MKRQEHVTILKVHELLTAFKTELIEHGHGVQGKRARTAVLTPVFAPSELHGTRQMTAVTSHRGLLSYEMLAAVLMLWRF